MTGVADSDHAASLSTVPEAEAIPREEQPWLDYALDQALILKDNLDRSTSSAVHTAMQRLSQIRFTASAHSLYTLELIKSYANEADELAFAKLKDCVLVAAAYPATTCGIVAGFGILGFKKPRNFLFRNSIRFFTSEESLLSNAEAKVKSLKQTVASMKHEGKKLEERALMAETDFLSGRTRLRQSSHQIQGLVNSIYKVEKRIRGFKDILGELPRKDASVFKSKVHTKRRNRLTQAKLNDLVYVMFNLKLKQREVKKKTVEDPLCLEDVDSGDEWISELQTCEQDAYHELDANTPLEVDAAEAEEEQDDSCRKKRKKAVVDIDEDEVHTGDDASDGDDDEENLNYMDDSLDDPMSSSESDDDSLAAAISSLASEVKREKRVLEKSVGKITGYGISV